MLHMKLTKNTSWLRARILLSLAGLCLAVTSLLSLSPICVAFGWLSAFLYVMGVKRSETLLKDLFLSGLVFHFVSMYWLIHTINYFGNFPWYLAFIFFIIFSLFSSLQFLFVGLLYRWFSKTLLAKCFLPLPLAWWLLEYSYPRLFPWGVAQSQIHWLSFASIAELTGVWLLSGLMFWWVETLVALVEKQGSKILVVPICLFVGLFWFGAKRTTQIEDIIAQAPSFNAAIVQGNLEAKNKNNPSLLTANLNTYQRISKEVIDKGAEILFWPEAVTSTWIPENIETLSGVYNRYHPYSETPVPLIFGGLSYRKPSEIDVRNLQTKYPDYSYRQILKEGTIYFNTAFGVDTRGNVLGHYHKKILMPFGEYIPFADKYPELKKLSPQTGDFGVGDISSPISVEIPSLDKKVKFGLLICYEDLVSSHSVEAVKHGAEVLVNLTNDAWYGDTAAPFQHHLLASWRAIETRRYLIRATNTGYTAVVDPLGRTVAKLPIFEEGAIQVKIAPLTIKSGLNFSFLDGK